ncbi:hypothetical protein K2X33_16605 [bacterium]|nr:hypothetical protein [bacterium]
MRIRIFFCLALVSSISFGGELDPRNREAIELDDTLVSMSQLAHFAGPWLFKDLSEGRRDRLQRIMAGSRGRWKFKGNPELQKSLENALSAELIHEKFPWESLSADCITDIRARFPGKPDKEIEWDLKLCDMEVVKKNQRALKNTVNDYRGAAYLRDRYVLFLNIVSTEIYGQVAKLKNLKSMVSSVGSCAPVSEAQIIRCLTADAKFRAGIEDMLVDTQAMLDAYASISNVHKIESSNGLYQILNAHRAQFVRVLAEQGKNKIQGILPE